MLGECRLLRCVAAAAERLASAQSVLKDFPSGLPAALREAEKLRDDRRLRLERLRAELRRRESLGANAQRAVADAETKCQAAEKSLARLDFYWDGDVIDTRFGRKTRAENLASLLSWADGFLSCAAGVRKQLATASAVEKPLIEAELQCVENEIAQKRVNTIREDVVRQLAQRREAREHVLAARSDLKAAVNAASAFDITSFREVVNEAETFFRASTEKVADLEERLKVLRAMVEEKRKVALRRKVASLFHS